MRLPATLFCVLVCAYNVRTCDTRRAQSLRDRTQGFPQGQQNSPSESLAFSHASLLNGDCDMRSSALAPGSSEAIFCTKKLLLAADAVFFDVDSTVVQTEGIDLLGKHFGVLNEISALTSKAMGGKVKFEDAIAERLQLLADHGMTRDSLDTCLKTEGGPIWSHDIREVIKTLHGQGTDVYLVSGGFQNMIAPLALELHIPLENVYANEILFDAEGKYTGFDRSKPTSRSGGKPEVLRMLQERHGYETMIMIGDGATDMDARTQGVASAFIGYGGVTVRDNIKRGADWFIYSFREILDVLQKGIGLQARSQ